MDIRGVLKWLTVTLVIVGALNWGLVGAFHFNAIALLFGEATMITRVIYMLVGLAGLYKLFMIAAKK